MPKWSRSPPSTMLNTYWSWGFSYVRHPAKTSMVRNICKRLINSMYEATVTIIERRNNFSSISWSTIRRRNWIYSRHAIEGSESSQGPSINWILHDLPRQKSLVSKCMQGISFWVDILELNCFSRSQGEAHEPMWIQHADGSRPPLQNEPRNSYYYQSCKYVVIFLMWPWFDVGWYDKFGWLFRWGFDCHLWTNEGFTWQPWRRHLKPWRFTTGTSKISSIFWNWSGTHLHLIHDPYCR